MNERWDLAAAARAAVAFREERDWGQFHAPKNLAAGLVIEAAELLELFQWDDVRPADAVIEDGERMERVAQELADVAMYALLLAHDLDIDLPEAIARKLADNERRTPRRSTAGARTRRRTRPHSAASRAGVRWIESLLPSPA